VSIVVYRDGIMAGDSGMWCGDYRDGAAKKVYRIDGWLVGVSGVYSECMAFVEAMKNYVQAPKHLPLPFHIMSDTDAIIVDPAGQARIVQKGGPFESRAPWCVIGSAARGAALGALHMGADAPTAVRIARFVGPWVQGIIHVEELDNKPERRMNAESEYRAGQGDPENLRPQWHVTSAPDGTMLGTHSTAGEHKAALDGYAAGLRARDGAAVAIATALKNQTDKNGRKSRLRKVHITKRQSRKKGR
jgi:hypothetical protein